MRLLNEKQTKTENYASLRICSEMRTLANMITMIRIVCSVILLFTIPLSSEFFIIYLFCGVSDVADGYIARKTNTTSKLGATLDSIADAIFIGIVLSIFIKIIKITDMIIIWILVIACVRILSLLIGFYRYHTFSFLHTYANKATGLILFCFPILLKVVGVATMASCICFFASISAMEEIIINLTSKELDRDVKGILIK